MAGSPRLKVSQFITLAKWTLVAVLLVALTVEMTRSGTAIVTMLLSTIRGCTAALYVFSCLDDQRGDAVKAAGCSDHLQKHKDKIIFNVPDKHIRYVDVSP